MEVCRAPRSTPRAAMDRTRTDIRRGLTSVGACVARVTSTRSTRVPERRRAGRGDLAVSEKLNKQAERSVCDDG